MRNTHQEVLDVRFSRACCISQKSRSSRAASVRTATPLPPEKKGPSGGVVQSGPVCCLEEMIRDPHPTTPRARYPARLPPVRGQHEVRRRCSPFGNGRYKARRHTCASALSLATTPRLHYSIASGMSLDLHHASRHAVGQDTPCKAPGTRSLGPHGEDISCAFRSAIVSPRLPAERRNLPETTQTSRYIRTIHACTRARNSTAPKVPLASG